MPQTIPRVQILSKRLVGFGQSKITSVMEYRISRYKLFLNCGRCGKVSIFDGGGAPEYIESTRQSKKNA
jgi:hypothetical protein